MIPEDSRVEIDAKIHAGYCKFTSLTKVLVARSSNTVTVTTGKIMTLEELDKVQGRAWDDIDVSVK